MTKSELIEIITAKQKHLPAKDVELALKQILEIMSDALSQGERIEIRGFGSFSLHFRPPRRSEEHTSELQSQSNLVCRLLLEKNISYSIRNIICRSATMRRAIPITLPLLIN